MDENDAWEPSPETAHPKARTLLTEPFYWSVVGNNTPLGNNNGYDTGAHYRRWQRGERNPDPTRFLADLMRSWGVEDADWDLLDPAALQTRLGQEWVHILTRDDMVIGLAFAQMILEGKVHPEVKRKALWAVERQALDVVIAYRGWSDPGERKRRLEQMRGVLTADWS